MEKYLPVSKLESPKLLKLIIFNYLFLNGDAHYKNFSVLETPMGDYRLSPAYDLLNSRIQIDDKDFVLDYGLLPRNLAQGKIRKQFRVLAKEAGINEATINGNLPLTLKKTDSVQKMIAASFLDDTTKRNYWQAYQGRLKQLSKD